MLPDINPIGFSVSSEYIQGRMDMAAIDPVHHARQRQRQTLDNATISAGRKKDLTAGLQSQIIVSTRGLHEIQKISENKKTEEQKKEQERLNQELENLQKQVQTVIKTSEITDSVVRNIKKENTLLNAQNEAASVVINALSPMMANYVGREIETTDKLSDDFGLSASVSSSGNLFRGTFNPGGILSAIPGFISHTT